ncbi:MAG: 23S rRNA (uracil(1939)-C(5))-methyltransferase RlmD [Myxococcales bacterium]|nr:23S rRNA (uracil(1939)-C(5))-methyltransferase RlmD [Myxococcales bacterium]
MAKKTKASKGPKTPKAPRAPRAPKAPDASKAAGAARPPRPSKAPKAQPVVEGRVEPIEIGQDGLTVATPRHRYAVPAAVVGDRVTIQPLSMRGRAPLRGRYQPAHLKRVLEHSKLRVPAPCVVLTRCGACSLQEMSYRAQIDEKNAALRRALARFGVAPERVDDVAPLSSPFGFRTKLLMPAETVDGALRFGLYRRGTFRLTPAEGCPVQHPLTLATLALARPVLEDAGVVATNSKNSEEGWLHALAVRVDPKSALSELTLCARDDNVPGGKRTIRRLLSLPGVASVFVSASAERSSYPLVPPFTHLGGAKRMTFNIGGLALQLSPGSFVQTNAEAADALIALVDAQLGDERLGAFVDLYGGAGVFARALAGRWERALVIEENPSAITDLEGYLRTKDAPKNLRARRGRAEGQLRALAEFGPDVVLLDPPRRGTKPGVVEAIVEAKPRTIVYVACGFGGLLRDLATLLGGGYQVTRAGGVDMFPHTSHLEVVVRLDRAPSA